MNDRRLFLKNGLVAVVGAVGAVTAVGKAEATPQARKYGMIIDLNGCTGRQSCVIACKAQNKTVKDRFNTKILTMEDGNYPNSRIVYTPVLCNQCENPPCVPACPARASARQYRDSRSRLRRRKAEPSLLRKRMR